MEKPVEENALVSVVIPTYNRAHLISDTIESVLSQTYRNIEILIIDDGSSDGTERVVQKFAGNRLQYIKIEHSGSFAVVRNLGIKKSKGKYIAFVDSDDIWHTSKIEKQLIAISESNCSFCFTQIEQFGDGAVSVPAYKNLQGKLLHYYFEEGHFAYYPSSLLFHQSVLNKTGLLNEKNLYGADPEFFVSLCHHFNGIFLSETLVRIRKHEKNTSSREPLFSYPEMTALLKKSYINGYIEKSLFISTISRLYYKMALIQKQRGKIMSSLKYFLTVIYYQPLNWKGWVRILELPVQAVIHWRR